MFMLMKLVKPFLLPPALIAVGLIISLIFLFGKRQKRGKALLLIVFAAYYLLSIEPVAYYLTRSIEGRVPVKEIGLEADDAEVIVILASGANKMEGNRPFPELGDAGWRRLWHGVELYRKFGGEIPILYSGGSGDPFDVVSIEAELAESYAVSMGIPDEMFWIEGSSRNTRESGAEIKRYLDERFPRTREHKIILVTSAYHMFRSMEVMERNGLYPIPSAADFRSGSLHLDPLSFIPDVGNFRASSQSIHEWVGIYAYRIMGRLKK